MGRINVGRVIVGGLLAGLIVNVSEFVLNTVVIGADMEAAMKALNAPPIGGGQIMWFVILGFVMSIALVWLYAAIRPRFGPGVTTAVYAALLVWVLAYAYPTAFMLVMKLFPQGLMMISLVWGLVEVVVAGIAGAWAYKET
jgi:hypothetical protein